MSTWLVYKKDPASRRASSIPQRVARLLLALALALCLGAFLGAGLAQASPQRAVLATLTFTAPNTKGLIGGPPGTKTTVRGGSWKAYSSVDLYVKPGLSGCESGVSLGTFPTDASGALAAHFLWPAGANQLADYHVCGVQSGKGTVFSHNTFTVLASSAPQVTATPSSALAGNTLTVNGSNWLPGPQTVSLIILPCSSLCSQAAVATGQVVADQNGAFSLQMTISAQAASGTYYIQATNGQSTLSAVSSPIQVSGQGQAGGTPVPGISPTSIATRSSQGGGTDGTTPKANNTIPALKAALLAAAAGIGAMAVLIGGGIFLLRITRSRGEAPSRGRQQPPAVAPLERFSPNSAARTPPPRDWPSSSRATYPSDRLALPPAVGRGRYEYGAQGDDTDPNIWEGEARTTPDFFPASSRGLAASAQGDWSAEKLPSEQIPYQVGNFVEVEEDEPAPPFPGMRRPAGPQVFRPHRPQQPRGRFPLGPSTGEQEDR